MFLPYRLIAIDLDGTLLDPQHRISPANEAAVAACVAGGARVRVLDVRWRLDRPGGRDEYLAAHVPGAVYVDLERDLARHGTPDEGRHPIPATAALQDAARRWGLDDGDTVVVYDDWNSVSAASSRASNRADVRPAALKTWPAGMPGPDSASDSPTPSSALAGWSSVGTRISKVAESFG